MRSDGTRIKEIPAFDKLIPYIMNRRYDATNFTRITLDITHLRGFLDKLREMGHKVGIMDSVICALTMVMESTPEINRFVANKKLYQRNHRCVSFAVIKRVDERIAETAVKVYAEDGDDLIRLSEKIRALIKENKVPTNKSKMDRFVDGIMNIPMLPSVSIRMIKLLDRFGLLPKSIIALSPFHTSMFISNLASIKMDYLYHHLYDFGTTSFFVTLGKPEKHDHEDGYNKLTLGISIDDRVCFGALWAKAMLEFQQLIENPERMVFSNTSSPNAPLPNTDNHQDASRL